MFVCVCTTNSNKKCVNIVLIFGPGVLFEYNHFICRKLSNWKQTKQCSIWCWNRDFGWWNNNIVRMIEKNKKRKLILPAAAFSCSCLISKYLGRSSPAMISFWVTIRRSGELVCIGTRATCGMLSGVSSVGVAHSVENRQKMKEKH